MYYAIALIDSRDEIAGLFSRKMEDRQGYDLIFTEGNNLQSPGKFRDVIAKEYDSAAKAERAIRSLKASAYGIYVGKYWEGVVTSFGGNEIEVSEDYDSDPDKFYTLEVVELEEVSY